MSGFALQPLTYSSKDRAIREWQRYETEPFNVVSAAGFYTKNQIPDGRVGDLIRIVGDDYSAHLKIDGQDGTGSFVTSVRSSATGAGISPIEVCDAFNVVHLLT